MNFKGKIDWISLLLIISLLLSIIAYSYGAIVLFTVGMEFFSLITFGILTYQNKQYKSRYIICEGVMMLIILSIIDGIFFNSFKFEINDAILGIPIFLRIVYNWLSYNFSELYKLLSSRIKQFLTLKKDK